MSNETNNEFFVAVTIHISRNKADQENNIDYTERAMKERGVGQFKHCLAALPVDVREANKRIRRIARTVNPIGKLVWSPFEEFEREE